MPKRLCSSEVGVGKDTGTIAGASYGQPPRSPALRYLATLNTATV